MGIVGVGGPLVCEGEWWQEGWRTDGREEEGKAVKGEGRKEGRGDRKGERQEEGKAGRKGAREGRKGVVLTEIFMRRHHLLGLIVVVSVYGR